VFLPTLGPAYNLDVANSHCVKRNFQVELAHLSLRWRANVLPLLRSKEFANFTLGFDGDIGGVGAIKGVHGGGHAGVGGEVCCFLFHFFFSFLPFLL
jgi:hypothetical protein